MHRLGSTQSPSAVFRGVLITKRNANHNSLASRREWVIEPSADNEENLIACGVDKFRLEEIILQ